MESRSRAFHAFPPAEAAARTWATPMSKWAVPLHTRPGLTRLGNVAATPCPPPVPAYILPHLYTYMGVREQHGAMGVARVPRLSHVVPQPGGMWAIRMDETRAVAALGDARGVRDTRLRKLVG